ncbi:MAG: transposase [Bacteroidota bacterium]
MPTGYKIAEQDQLYHLTLQVVGWVDLFTRKSYRDMLIQNLAFCQQNKALEIFAYVIMSNHIHLLVKSNTGNLSNTIRDFKSFTSKELLKLIKEPGESRREWMLEIFKNAASQHVRNSEFQLWTHENHAEHIYSNQFISQKINYIHENPVVAGIVLKAEDYPYSRAKNYTGEPGLIPVTILEGIYTAGNWKSGGWPVGGCNSGEWQSGGWNVVR